MGDDEELELRREAARHDGQRIGRAVRLGDVGGPGRIVPCRDCGVDVEVSQWVIDIARQFDDHLLRKGERPLEDGELTRCAACAEVWKERNLNTALRIAERVKTLVLEVKAGRDLTADQFVWLRRNGYSDTADGMEAIMRRRRDDATKGRKKGDA